MPSLYVASTETFVGKSAVCIGLLHHMQRDGLRVNYMKPVSVSVAHTADAVLDQDAAFIRETFDLKAPLEQIAPVLVTPSMVEAIMRDQQQPFDRKLKEAYVAASRDTDVLVLEGTNSWSEGALVDLSADQVSDLLDAPALLVVRYRTTLAIDAALSVQRYMGDRLLGVLINQVEEPQLDFVRTRVAPFLEKRGIPVLGVLPQDTGLGGVTVGELQEELGGQLIGNIRPNPRVIDRAEEREVPIILVPDDTLSTVERADRIFGNIRFHQRAKVDRFVGLLDTAVDWKRLYAALGVNAG